MDTNDIAVIVITAIATSLVSVLTRDKNRPILMEFGTLQHI